MAVAQPTVATTQARVVTPKRQIPLGSIFVNVTLAIICILWTLPTLGLLISAFRPREDIAVTGWWAVLPHQAWITTAQVQLQTGISLDHPLTVNGNTVTDDQLRAGYTLPNGQQVKWANRRSRLVNVQEKQLTSVTNFTLGNYQNVLTGQEYTTKDAQGNIKTERGDNMSGAFISTLAVAIPATLIPILIAA